MVTMVLLAKPWTRVSGVRKREIMATKSLKRFAVKMAPTPVVYCTCVLKIVLLGDKLITGSETLVEMRLKNL
jgi:hypothetical protein